jgi:hypothetical protein
MPADRRPEDGAADSWARWNRVSERRRLSPFPSRKSGWCAKELAWCANWLLRAAAFVRYRMSPWCINEMALCAKVTLRSERGFGEGVVLWGCEGQWVRVRRDEAGWTKEELAKLVRERGTRALDRLGLSQA